MFSTTLFIINTKHLVVYAQLTLNDNRDLIVRKLARLSQERGKSGSIILDMLLPSSLNYSVFSCNVQKREPQNNWH